MLIDEAYIVVRAGKGGDGKVSFFPGAKTGPDGGRGGEGGSVYARVNRTISSLNHYVKQKLFVAEDGKVGQSFQKTGADGDDLILDVPVGTTFINLETQEEVELMNEGELVPLCRGGWGGKGNMQLTNARFTAPRRAEKGKPGQEKKFKVLLKLIADFGLIGLPNAGKSSLLNELTAANVKTAAYAFTTLEPNLGAFYNRVIADIPGLIEGASSGKGLGTKFLKHIEKVQMLLHCVAADSADMMRD
ncbi:GTPase ObgE [Candidatus Roizmanbacteria bacterium]|nr:GTPase ObgE [Candidatus Roizmanbacteria bacterium]